MLRGIPDDGQAPRGAAARGGRPAARRGALLAVTAAAGSLAACGGSSGPVDGAAAMEHVRNLVAIGPRPFGSDNLARAADYITGQLRELGLEPRRHEVLHEREQKMLRNLYVQIDGEDPQKGPILMIGAHYDTKLTEGHADRESHNFEFVGAIDGGGGPAVLLELARVLKERQPRPAVNVWLYWIDAEESIDFHWNDERALLGSKAFAGWLDAEGVLPRVKAFVLLDLVGAADMKIDRDLESNEQLQKLFANAAAEMGVEDRVYRFESQFTDDHIVFRDHGVPSVLLIDFHLRVPEHLFREMNPDHEPPDPQGYTQWWHTADDTVEMMSAGSLALAGNLVVQAFPALQEFVLKRTR